MLAKKYLIPFLLSGIVLLSSCGTDENTNGTTTMQVRLTDSPGDYAEVNVDVQSVQIKKSDGDDENGWITLDEVNSKVYNLLDFANGTDTLLASSTLPSGHVSQIRLVLGSNNTLKLKNGEVVELKTPSGQTSGVKLQLNATLEDDLTYIVLLDFDAAKSVVQRGNGQYLLKPVVRAITNAVAGGIKGKVTPAAYAPAIYAISAENDTIGGFADETGSFLLRGVKAGTYAVEFHTAGQAHDTTLTNVVVSQTAIKDVGTVTLPE